MSDGYRRVPLKRLFRIVNGSTPKSAVTEYWDGDISWITPEDLGNLKSNVIQTSRRRITEAGLATCGTSLVPPGSIILSTRAPIGNIALAGTSLCTNQGCKTLVPRSSNVVTRYFYYQIQVLKEHLNVLGNGTTFLELNSSELGRLRVAEPNTETQFAVADFLDDETTKTDAMVAKYGRLVELLEEKRAALVMQAVTKGLDSNAPMKGSGVEWLGCIPKHWNVLPLRHLGTFQSGSGFPDAEQGLLKEEIAFYKVGDLQGADENGGLRQPAHTISASTAKKLGARVFEPGTVVFAKVGAALMLNRYRSIQRFSCIDNNMMAISLDKSKLSKAYALALLPFLDLKRIVNPGALPSINASQIKAERIPVPSLAEQDMIDNAISHRTKYIDSLKAKCQKSIDLLKEHRAALITAAVTGQIDVLTFRAKNFESKEMLA